MKTRSLTDSPITKPADAPAPAPPPAPDILQQVRFAGQPKVDPGPQPRGAPPVAGSKQLLDLMLEADKSAVLGKLDDAGRAAEKDRDVARRVGSILMTTPYAAPLALIVKSVRADPVVSAHWPDLDTDALFVLHKRFPELVPRPNLPVDFGTSYAPTMEGYLDLYISKFATAQGRRGLVAQAVGDPAIANVETYYEQRYGVRNAANGIGFDNHLLNKIDGEIGKMRRAEGLAAVLLRRVIQSAPPTWGVEEIATAKPTWHYWLKDGRIVTVIADGLPANFNDVNVVPPEFIDVTMAMSIAAGVQAMTGRSLWFEDLNDGDHAMLEKSFATFLDRLADGEPGAKA